MSRWSAGAARHYNLTVAGKWRTRKGVSVAPGKTGNPPRRGVPDGRQGETAWPRRSKRRVRARTGPPAAACWPPVAAHGAHVALRASWGAVGSGTLDEALSRRVAGWVGESLVEKHRKTDGLRSCGRVRVNRCGRRPGTLRPRHGCCPGDLARARVTGQPPTMRPVADDGASGPGPARAASGPRFGLRGGAPPSSCSCRPTA